MKKITLVAYLLFATQLIYSKENILSFGEEVTGSGGSVSYFVGQLVYITHAGSGAFIQGVQESIEFFTLNNAELSTVNLTAVMYPKFNIKLRGIGYKRY